MLGPEDNPIAMSRLPLFAAAALTASLPAQVVSPDPHFATREGDVSIPYAFSQPSRLLQIHEDLVGAPRVIQGLSFRRDGIGNGAPHAALSPKTITLTVTMGDAVFRASANATFASNFTGTVTTVFSGTISTPPTWSVEARTAPTPFDFRIPLTPYLHLGAQPLAWDADSTATSDLARVNLDAAQSAFPLFAWCAYAMQGTGCTTPNGTFDLRGSGQNLGGLSTFTVKVTTTRAPSSTACAWLLGFAPIGLPITGLCIPLWPQLAASVTTTSDATGRAEPFFQVSSNPIWLGVPMEMQMFAADATQAGIPVVGSNGLSYRVEAMAPAFNVGCVVSGTPSSSTGTVLSSRAVVVQFD